MSRAIMIDYYVDKVVNNDLQFHEIRQELERHNVDEDEIKVIVRLVDSELQRRVARQDSNRKHNSVVLFGGVIAFVGAFMTLGTYFGLIDTGGSYIIAYGPFFAGLSILVTGLARMRK